MPLSLDGTTGISASGNITGGNVIASGSLIVGSFSPASLNTVGNVTGGNLTTAGLITATGNITGGNIRTAGVVSATGNIDGGNLRTAGLISSTGAITAGGDLSLVGNIVDTGPMTVTTSSNGNITLAPNGTGVVIVNTDIRNGQVSGTGNIGASGAVFNTIFARATSAQYADLAEMYESDKLLDAGQVVEFGGSKEIQQTTTSHSTRVAGIVSSSPSYLMNSALQAEFKAPVALTGRVPCYVVGTIKKGDRLVSSDQRGIATVLDMTKYEPGCILGKALEDYNSQDIGRIEVAVGRF
jgi:trimeric autotransporter adhesin